MFGTGDSRTSDDRTAARRRSISAVLTFTSLLVVLTFLARTSADGDLWGHLTFGRDIVRTGAVHTSDPYSFTSDRAWVNHEWLAEAAMWTAYAWGGAPGLIALKLLVVWVAGALLVASWRPAGLRSGWRDGLLFLTALGVWPLVATIRPQVFSVAMFAALLFALERVRVGARLWLLALPPLFAVWVNVHGGWVVGAGALAMFAGCALCDRAQGLRHKTLIATTCAASAVATLCNPYGTSMLAFLAETVRPERAEIVEWRPLSQLPATVMVLWVIPALMAGSILWSTVSRSGEQADRRLPQIPLWSILTVCVLAIGSFRVARLVGFFALAVAFLAVPHLRRSVTPAPGVRHFRSPHVGPGLKAPAALHAAACVVLIGLAVAFAGRRIVVDGPWFPEPEVTTFVETHHLRGRMLTWFDYGEYAIWHFAPDIKVSMDGRRETVYSDAMRDLHFRAYRGGHDGLEAVSRLRPDYVWMPSASPLVSTLQDAGWTTAFKGSRSSILSRTNVIALAGVHAAPLPPRSFPGP